jgi:hypothetical protein
MSFLASSSRFPISPGGYFFPLLVLLDVLLRLFSPIVDLHLMFVKPTQVSVHFINWINLASLDYSKVFSDIFQMAASYVQFRTRLPLQYFQTVVASENTFIISPELS